MADPCSARHCFHFLFYLPIFVQPLQVSPGLSQRRTVASVDQNISTGRMPFLSSDQSINQISEGCPLLYCSFIWSDSGCMYIITKQHPVVTFKKCNTKNCTDTHDHSADRLKAIKLVHLVQGTTITSNKIKHTTKHKTVIFMTKYKTKIPQNVRTICINLEYFSLLPFQYIY